MQNKVQEGKSLTFLAAGAVASGAPVALGQIVGIATIAAAAANDVITVETEGVFSVTANGVDGVGNSAIANGDKLFFVSADAIKISKKATGIEAGIAYDDTKQPGATIIAAGASGTVNIRLKG